MSGSRQKLVTGFTKCSQQSIFNAIYHQFALLNLGFQMVTGHSELYMCDRNELLKQEFQKRYASSGQKIIYTRYPDLRNLISKDKETVYLLNAYYKTDFGKIANDILSRGLPYLSLVFYPPRFDRFKRILNEHRRPASIVDRILTNKVCMFSEEILWPYRRYLEQSRYVIVQSEEAKNSLSKFIDPAFIQVIPGTYDMRYFHHEQNEVRETIVLFHSSNISDKTLANQILQIVQALRPKLIQIINGFMMKSYYATLLSGWHYEFIDRFEQDCWPQIYRSAMLTIYPEEEGSFEIPILESLASGVPVISYEKPSSQAVNTISDFPSKPVLYFERVDDVEKWYQEINSQRVQLAEKINFAYSAPATAKRYCDLINKIQ